MGLGKRLKEFIEKNKKIIILLAVLIAWLAVMIFLSSQNGTKTENTSGFLAKLVANILYGESAKKHIIMIDSVFRKSAHIIIYAVFGGILYSLSNCFKMKEWRKLGICTSIVILISVLDELHKLPIDGRHFDIPDVFLNIVGGVVVLLIIAILNIIKHSQSEKKQGRR